MSRSTGESRSASRTLSTDWVHRRLRWLSTAGAVSAAVLAFGLPASATPTPPTQPPGSTSPTTPTGEVTPALVELTGLVPLDPAAAPSVTFQGTVTNRSDQPLRLLNAYLRLSRVPLVDRDDLVRIAEPTFRPGARQPSFVPVTDVLDPGDTAPFTLEVTTDDLGLSEPGVYAAGIEVLATIADGSRGVVGRAMTALPWVPATAEVDPVGVAVAWPVTAPVDRATDGTYLSDDLAEAFEPGGRLAAVLSTSVDAPVTWLIDPSVVEAAADLADGYEIRTDPTDPAAVRAGSSTESAGRWLDQVRRLTDAGRVTLTPYANVDAVALVRAGLGEQVEAALDAADTAAQSLGLTRANDPRALLRPPGGFLDPAAAAELAAAGVTTLLLDGEGVDTPSEAPTARLAAGDTTITAVVADEALQNLFAAEPDDVSASPAAAALAARQLLLAHTALAALSAPTDTVHVGQTVLVVSGDESSTTSPDSVLAALDQDVPWMQQVTIDSVQASPMADGDLAYPERAREAELSARYLADVTAVSEKAALLGALVAPAPDDGPDTDAPDPSGLDNAIENRLRAESAGWREFPGRAAALLADASAAIDAELQQVRILDGGGITLSSQTGRFPLTVVNDLAVPVVVQLNLASRTPARLRVPSLTGIAVPAGARTTVDVSAEANANGAYVVDAQLATSTGEPFGPTSPLTIRATDYDTVAWIIMGVATGLLLIGSGRRIIRRVRADRAESTPAVTP